MSEQTPFRAGKTTTSWAVGFILFAAIMMLMAGIFQALQGLVAIFENEFYVATRNYLFQFDATTWGWIHLIVGVIVAFAGWGLLTGRTWARVVAITVAVLSAIANFAFIPYYPFWSLLIITLDIFVIWAVAAHGGQMRDSGIWRERRRRAGWEAGITHFGWCRRSARLNPLAGLAVGAATGAIAGKLTDVGINDDTIKQIGQQLQQGKAAVFILARSATVDKVIDALKPFNPTVIQTNLTKDREEELVQALQS